MFNLIEIELIHVSTGGARVQARVSRQVVSHARARDLRQKVEKEEGGNREISRGERTYR